MPNTGLPMNIWMPSYQDSTRPMADASETSISCRREGSIISPPSAPTPIRAAITTPRVRHT